jgi:hypothetical protein
MFSIQPFSASLRARATGRGPAIRSTHHRSRPRRAWTLEALEDRTLLTLINFDNLPAMPFGGSAIIPAYAQLSTQLANQGVIFSTGLGADYVGVIALGIGHATSGANGIGMATKDNTIAFSSPYYTVIEFVDPSNPSAQAVTDFASIRGDLAGSSNTLTMQAFDLNGNLLGTDTQPDVGGETVSLSIPGIHSVHILPSTVGPIGGIGLDDLTFDPPVPATIDTTAPTTTATLSGSAGAHGWFTGPVTVTLTSTDPDNPPTDLTTTYQLDGGPTTTYNPAQPLIIAADGVHTLQFQSRDPAGNLEPLQTRTIDIDQAPPSLTATADPATLWPPNGRMVTVTVTGEFTDATSGIDPTSAAFAVVDEYGQVQPSGPAQVDAATGTYSFHVQLQASRLGGDLDGRSYTILVTGPDLAGNLGRVTTTVLVPHDQRGPGSGGQSAAAPAPGSGARLGSRAMSLAAVPIALGEAPADGPAGPLVWTGGFVVPRRLRWLAAQRLIPPRQ